MDEYDDEVELDSVEVEADEGSEAPTDLEGRLAYMEKQLEKKNRENRSLRERNRRTELASKFGPDIADLIPGALPLKEWEGYAERLAALKGQAVETQDSQGSVATLEAAVEQPTEQEQRAAALVKPGTGATGTPGRITDVGDAVSLAFSDPRRYAELKAAGLIALEKLPGSPQE